MATVKQCDNCKILQTLSGRFSWVQWKNWVHSREFCSNKCLFIYIGKYHSDEES